MAQQARPDDAVARYRAGFQMLQARDMRNAAIEFEQAVKADSTYGDAHYALGKSLVALGEFDKAIDAYEAARRHGVSSEKATRTLPLQLSEIYFKSALRAREQRRYQEAIAAFQRSLELAPEGDPKKRARAHYGIGLCYSALRETEAARASFQQVISLDASYVQAYKALGDMHRRAREHRQAADMYSRAVSADPEFMEGYAGLARVQMDTDDLEGAVATLEKALGIDDGFAYGQLLLGTSMNQLGRHSEAVAPLRRAIEIDPSVAEAHYRLAEAYFGKGDYRDAIAAAEQAVRRQRNYHAAQVILGDSYAKLSQDTEARSWYQKARSDSRFRDYCDHQIQELDRQRDAQQ
jgi:tetratricopeptide (TPR) repeat protein